MHVCVYFGVGSRGFEGGMVWNRCLGAVGCRIGGMRWAWRPYQNHNRERVFGPRRIEKLPKLPSPGFDRVDTRSETELNAAKERYKKAKEKMVSVYVEERERREAALMEKRMKKLEAGLDEEKEEKRRQKR